MNDRIRHILQQMNTLEEDLRAALHEQESRMFFRIRGKRVEFEADVKTAHRRIKTNLLRWFASSRPQNLLSAPFIYSMIVPMVILDLFVTVYQAICFPLYQMARVRRDDYVVFDRQHLEYLNIMERLHCTYCAYANGLLGYVGEIAARTEQYWCPIKHAHKVLGTHARYAQFLDYGDAHQYHAGVARMRSMLADELTRPPVSETSSQDNAG